MPALWDSDGPALLTPSGPEPDGPARDGLSRAPEPSMQAPQIDWNATGLSRDAVEPIAYGLGAAYGPAWQQDYGTLAGRTLTGATPEEAFPAAATPEQQQVRDALAQILAPGQAGSDHPDVQAVLRGALADGMPQADRAVVNQAAIDAAVGRDPAALLDVQTDRRITPARLAAWRDLIQTPMPQSIVSRMDAMNGPIQSAQRADQVSYDIRMQYREPNEIVTMPSPTFWRPHPISEAVGPIVNMDEYAVRVERMPAGLTPAAFLREIRGNMDGFVDTAYSEFAPYPEGAGPTSSAARWASDNPTGSFLTIDIPGPDNGTVAVIGSSEDHWTFATVQSPQDDHHPVSGNRQFGYDQHADGSVTFYTRGVDRITTTALTRVNQATPGSTGAWGSHTDGAVFSGGDNLWRTFQQKVAKAINDRDGVAEALDPVATRIEWNRVDDVLLGRESVRSFFNREAGR